MVSAPKGSATFGLERRQLVTLAAILAVAFALRLAYVLGQRGDILFDHPAMDEERYVQMARDMAAGRPREAIPWFQPPGLVYALAVVFKVAGDGLLAPRVVQAVISTVACLVAFAIARRFFGVRIALATAAICAVHGVLVFESYELLPPTWAMTADLVAIWALLRAGEGKTPLRAFGAGVALGVSAVFAPIVLPFALVAAVWLRRSHLVLAFVAGLALAIAPVTSGNWKRGHELVTISTNGGVNFYLGNNADYDSTLALRPGRHWTELVDDEPAKAGARTAVARSAYFTKKALSFYRTQPGRALSLYARKVYLYFNGVELPRDTDLYAERRSSTLLSVLVARGPPSFPDGLLLPLGLVGVALSLRERRKDLLVPLGFLGLQAACVAAFFVTSRYRMPALPLYAMFACAGAVGSWQAAARGRTAVARAAPSLVTVAVVVLLGLPVREGKASYAAERDFYRGLAHLTHRHDPVAAIEAFQRAAALDPSDARIWFELGNALSSARRVDEAIDAWRRAAALDPTDPRATARAVAALIARGDVDAAIAAIESDIAARGRPEASYASDHLNLAMLRARRGDSARAIDDLKTAAREDLGYFRASIIGWTRAALDTAGLGDAAFWLGVGDAVRDMQPQLAKDAWKRARASGPSAAQADALSERLGP